MLDLGKEKIEWVDAQQSARRFKRLRRAPVFGTITTGAAEDKDYEGLEEDVTGDADADIDDDSGDEDWENAVGNEESKLGEDEYVDLDDEEMDDIEMVAKAKGKLAEQSESRKRKSSGGIEGSAKKRNDAGAVGKGTLYF